MLCRTTSCERRRSPRFTEFLLSRSVCCCLSACHLLACSTDPSEGEVGSPSTDPSDTPTQGASTGQSSETPAIETSTLPDSTPLVSATSTGRDEASTASTSTAQADDSGLPSQGTEPATATDADEPPLGPDQESFGSNENTSALADSGVPGPPATADRVDNEEIYDPERIPRFDIELPTESLTQLAELTQDHPLAKEYVRGTFRYDGEELFDVGVRFKGEGSWRPLDRKTAWKIKFDKFVDDQHLLGLKRLTLNNMVEDPSFVAERLAYDVYRAAGLPAPRCNSALVYVNGEFYGVYANVEAIDKPFLRRWFDDDEGNLYEEGQSDFLPGSESTFDLETNETANDRSDLTRLIDALSAVRGGAPWSELEAVIDAEQFLLFTAAEAAVNQWDMYAFTRFYPNNFRFYHDPTSDQFVFVPWGMDLSMKPFRDSGKPHIPLFELATQGDFDGGRVVAGQLYQTCLLDDTCRERFMSASETMIEVYESLDLETLAVRYAEQLRSHIEVDPRQEYSMTQVEAALQATLETIRGRADAMRSDLETAALR